MCPREAGLPLTTVAEPLEPLLRQALLRRAALFEALHEEGTNCYRLFHGAVEGLPGVAIDRYGPVLLVQTWSRELESSQLDDIQSLVGDSLGVSHRLVWNHRVAGQDDFERWFPFDNEGDLVGSELGLNYDVCPRHRGRDPLLFLDLRAGRRVLLERARGRDVLNLFAYTCGLGLAAARGGAASVLNVDFAASALTVGMRNAALNEIDPQRFGTLRADVLPTIRQLAGLPVKGRASRRRSFEKLAARQFDCVLLDPPAWSKGPFGAVDVVRDYSSLFKPALLATRPGGVMLVTNNSARVDWESWIDLLERSARKAGRPLRGVERIVPETDFPSPDGRHPLKVAWLQV